MAYKKTLYYQKGVLALLTKKKYSTYLMIGELWCASTWLFVALKKLIAPREKVYFWTHGWYGKENMNDRQISQMREWLHSEGLDDVFDSHYQVQVESDCNA